MPNGSRLILLLVMSARSSIGSAAGFRHGCAPDHLTAFGLGGAILAAAGYAASVWRREFIFVACLGIVINWLGDSLDGSLARHRGIERAKLGYFIDHSVDALSTVFIMTGIGASYYASMTAALFTLAGYLLMSIHVFLKNSATGKMQLTFMYCGPTEIRLAILFFNLVAYCSGINTFNLIGHEVQPYSLVLYAFGAVFILLFASDTLKTARVLHREDMKLRPVTAAGRDR